MDVASSFLKEYMINVRYKVTTISENEYILERKINMQINEPSIRDDVMMELHGLRCHTLNNRSILKEYSIETIEILDIKEVKE